MPTYLDGATKTDRTLGDVDTDVTAIKAVTDLLPDAGALSDLAAIRAVVDEIDQHNHNIERWWGAVAVPGEINAIEANVNRPFQATSGANTWGAAIPICGSADNPVLTTQTEFDAHRVLVVDLDNQTDMWRLRIIWGTGTSAAAISADQWSEVPVISNATPGNRAGGVPVAVRMPPIAVGTKLWAQSWNDTLNEVLQFQWGAHGYPYLH